MKLFTKFLATIGTLSLLALFGVGGGVTALWYFGRLTEIPVVAPIVVSLVQKSDPEARFISLPEIQKEWKTIAPALTQNPAAPAVQQASMTASAAPAVQQASLTAAAAPASVRPAPAVAVQPGSTSLAAPAKVAEASGAPRVYTWDRAQAMKVSDIGQRLTKYAKAYSGIMDKNIAALSAAIRNKNPNVNMKEANKLLADYKKRRASVASDTGKLFDRLVARARETLPRLKNASLAPADSFSFVADGADVTGDLVAMIDTLQITLPALPGELKLPPAPARAQAKKPVRAAAVKGKTKIASAPRKAAPAAQPAPAGTTWNRQIAMEQSQVGRQLRNYALGYAAVMDRNIATLTAALRSGDPLVDTDEARKQLDQCVKLRASVRKDTDTFFDRLVARASQGIPALSNARPGAAGAKSDVTGVLIGALDRLRITLPQMPRAIQSPRVRKGAIEQPAQPKVVVVPQWDPAVM